MARLSDDALMLSMRSIPAWTGGNDAIRRTFSFRNYYETIAFVNAIAWHAHQTDHHPDLEVAYNRCVVTYSTHSEGGVTELDIENARAIDALLPSGGPP